jgi:hypothetical protein
MPINSELDLVIQQDDLVVFGPPSIIDIGVDIGPQGERGSQFFVGTGNPNSISIPDFENTYGEIPRFNDIFLRIDLGEAYGTFYRYSSVPGAEQWEPVIELLEVIDLFFLLNEDFILPPASGGTGVDNGLYTITLSNNLSTSGGFPINLNTSGSVNVMLPTSGSVAVWQDKLNAFAPTTSAEFASIITDETGTGLLVFNINPNIIDSLTTTSTSFNLLNANATTINFAGDATSLFIGATSGSTTISNDLFVVGQITGNVTGNADTVTNVPKRIINQKTNSYTLQLSDAQSILEFNSASAMNLTIPEDSSVDFPVGSYLDIVQTGSAEVEIEGDGVVAVLSKNSETKTSGQYSRVHLYKQLSNTWILSGDLSS